ncbi:MAG: glycosyltransferase [Deltaproteobacteria bacterium]|nr:glycosyltransferase [Deltaproteobacteria bacterium]MBW2152792.1 glycosyltransferase [Deltaproteobacteria bacterium]
MKPTILFLIRSLGVGGTERQLYSLIQNIHKSDFRCHVFTFESEGLLIDPLQKLDVSVYVGGLQSGDVVRASWKLTHTTRRMISCIYNIKPKIIHAFLPLVTSMGACFGRLLKVPVVITSRRALATHQDRHPSLKMLDRIANRASHWITVNSLAIKKDIIERNHVDPSKLILIYNGVDVLLYDSALSERNAIRRGFDLHPARKVVICVANLIHYKGHSDLLQAASLVVEREPDSIFLIVGEDRGIQKNLEQQISSLGLHRHVRLLGCRLDIPRLLAASDVSVVPSHEEGFSNFILESMAAGLPVVATNVGGNPEAIISGKTGWLVPPRNPTALANKIVDLLQDPNKAKQWGAKGKKRVQELFPLEKMVQGYLKLYKEALSCKRV